MKEEKELNDMTTEELGQLFPIIISEYNSKWKEYYIEAKKQLLALFTMGEIVRVEHIGSTAIPEIKSKPTIDILLEINENTDTKLLIKKIESLGYHYVPQHDNPPPHIMFARGYTKQGFKGQAYHIHVRYPGDWHEIRFRDYLLENKDVAKEYEKLKLQLADKYRNDREAYTDAKTKFIVKILEKIGS